MTNSQQFHFNLLRITIVQIVKSVGFDRARPTTINTLTDLYIRYMGLLIEEATRCSRLAGRDDLLEQDICQAMSNMGIINTDDMLDAYADENQYMKKFLHWCVGEVPQNARNFAFNEEQDWLARMGNGDDRLKHSVLAGDPVENNEYMPEEDLPEELVRALPKRLEEDPEPENEEVQQQTVAQPDVAVEEDEMMTGGLDFTETRRDSFDYYNRFEFDF